MKTIPPSERKGMRPPASDLSDEELFRSCAIELYNAVAPIYTRACSPPGEHLLLRPRPGYHVPDPDYAVGIPIRLEFGLVYYHKTVIYSVCLRPPDYDDRAFFTFLDAVRFLQINIATGSPPS